MSRVLIAFGGYGGEWTGAERMAWKTAEHLALHGHTGAVLTDSLPPRAPDAGPWPRVRDPREFGRPDVVHAFDLARPRQVAVALSAATGFGCPFVLTPATAVELWPDPDLGRAACRAAAAVYVLTRAEADNAIAAGADPAAIRYIPQAPHLDAPVDPSGLRARFAGATGTVLFLGRRTAFKGYQVLLAAAPLVRLSRPGTAFWLAGPGADDPATSPADGLYDFGVVDAAVKQQLLAAADVLCLPSTFDVYPLVFVEAWACGTPVVSGPFQGAGEVVRHGVDGLVVDAEPGALAEALAGLLADEPKRRAMGAAGRRRVERENTWEQVAAAVAAGYPAESAWLPASGGER
ncbi:glycosyltransferase family 4 protein [Lentzea aerocolonigenes]|uniref:glycosyltransferase family 4 protein n=1 Tax=Lentzea aerocolonigenes TaxID=68170 RepID=UPI0004C2B7EE|nr:glycosyltransferase [Lentzea aerocolonigenes]MCP2243465.1 Glycosyltransferase involved in cell wall bisynthesis [Lentzea aerocolonigenes]